MAKAHQKLEETLLQLNEELLQETFLKISGENMEIDSHQLRDILNAAFMREFKFGGFTDEGCRSMVAMMDEDRSGKLGLEEFKKLWMNLRLWKAVFKKHDKDQDGSIDSYELKDAFRSVGFQINNSTFKCLIMRYSNKDGKLNFGDFIMCVTKMKSMCDTFHALKRGKNAQFTLDEFIQTTLYS